MRRRSQDRLRRGMAAARVAIALAAFTLAASAADADGGRGASRAASALQQGSATAPPGTVRLEGSLAPAIARASQVGTLDPAQEIEFAFTLPVRDPAGLEAFMKALYTPGDPLYRHYLKTGEFTDRFGPSQADYDAVIAFAEQHGLRVMATHTNRAVLDVAGPVQAIESALGIRMMRYRAANGRVFRAPDVEPALPAAIEARVAGVVGLDDAVQPKSNLLGPLSGGGARLDTASPIGGAGRRLAAPSVGTGPGNAFAPADIRAAYNLNGLAENGAGQTIALFELDGYRGSDITAYEDQFGLPHVTLTNVLLNGVSGTPTAPTVAVPYPPGPSEVTLDIELAIALAPSATAIVVYEGTSYTDLYNRIATDNTAQQVSTSWYYGLDSDPPVAVRNAENTAFVQMAAQGQSFFAASGDFGSNVRTGSDANGNPILQFGVQDPSAQPYVIGVGGTLVSSNVVGGPWSSETSWSGSGGGISTIWTLPGYQSAAIPAGSGGSATFRNVPDVSLDSGSGYSIYFYGAWQTYIGTSCAAPLWAGFTALVNQRRADNGLGRVGFLNPALYFLGHSGRYATDMHDITTGSNGAYAAVAGYDNVTGWGTLNGANLIGDLLVDPGILYVDGNFTGSPQIGTPAHPYTTVTQAANAAIAGQPTLVYVKGFNYLENLTTSKSLLLVNNGGGVVRIGN
jgi:kumamolisin